MGVGIEGNAPPLRETVPRYKQSGRYKGADFGPILGRERDQGLFMAANIYGDPFCTLTAVQYETHTPNTSLTCAGISTLPLEFLADLAEALQIEPVEPSKGLKEAVDTGTIPLLMIYRQAKQMQSPKLAATLISKSLQMQQQVYHRKAHFASAPDN